jgi:small GTP-binding protein
MMFDRRVKFILVGDSCVGKTSLALKFLGYGFSTETTSTTSSVFLLCDIPVDGETISAEIWDTAGQERYRSLMSLYYRGANVAIICASNETVGSVPEWVEAVREATLDPVIVLVITKCDLYESGECAELQKQAETLAKELLLSEFVMISAKNDVGVNEVFTTAARLAARGFRRSVVLPTTTKNKCC